MSTYLIKRLLEMIPTLFGITLLSFVIIHLAPGKPTDIFTELNPKITPEARERLEKLYDLDKPIIVQYGLWLKKIVKLDFGLTEQALYNILQNISFHTPEKTRAYLNITLKEGILEIIISDDGPGFREEDRLRAFEKFYRSASSKSGGLGLGLSIAKGFIQAQGGEISIDNKPSGGAIFEIRIPVVISNVIADEP